MSRRLATFAVLLSLVVIFLKDSSAATSESKPLRASEVLALVAGIALPETVISHIKTDHLAFRPDDFYRGLLKSAGADPKVLAALDSAKIDTDQSPEHESGKELLQHLAAGAIAMNAGHYDQASSELKTALVASLNSPEVYFVAGELLRREDELGSSAATYRLLLTEDPSFPDAHAKLSYITYETGDADSALQEAEMAVKQDPANPEAHLNVGLDFDAMKKFGASEAEYKQALSLKPDYWAAHLDLGYLRSHEGRWDDALSEYKKVIALKPQYVSGLSDAYYNMGWTYDQENNIQAALKAYREAETIDPKRYDARQNLGRDLLRIGKGAEAVQEFRALEQLYPDSEMCAVSLGQAYFAAVDFDNAEREYKRAISLDPSDSMPHVDVGDLYETQKKYSAALAEYNSAEKLDPTNPDAYTFAGRTYIEIHDYAHAADQLDRAEQSGPESAEVHDLYGQALMGLTKFDAAVGEYQQSLSLQPGQLQVMMRLADAFEKKGDWVSAMREYRKASLTDASMDYRGRFWRSDDRDPQKEYKAAQDRLAQHLAALRASENSAKADAIESAIHSAQADESLSDQLDAAMLAGANAGRAKHYDEETREFQHAVDLAEKMQPHDPRLVTALDDLGNCYLGWNGPAAESAYERELKAAQDLFGPASPNVAGALQSLGRNALMQKDYPTAEKFFFRAVDINSKAFGESSDRVADSLIQASTVYFVEKDYAKAEPYVLRAVNIDESLYGHDSINLVPSLTVVCALYERWGKPDKMEPYNREMIAALEKGYGPDSPVLAPVLDKEAKALRALDKNDEAEHVENRAAKIRTATMKPN